MVRGKGNRKVTERIGEGPNRKGRKSIGEGGKAKTERKKNQVGKKGGDEKGRDDSTEKVANLRRNLH